MGSETGALRRLFRDRRSALLAIAPVAFFLVLALAVLGPLLKPGYILTLDMVYGPLTAQRAIEHYVYGIMVNQADAGASPTVQVLFALLSRFVNLLLPMWMVQKLWLVLLLTLGGLFMYVAAPINSRIAKYWAGLFYVVNPFVLVRFLAGHFFILWGVAFLPIVFVWMTRMLDRPTPRNAAILAMWLTLLAASVHFLVMAMGLLLVLTVVYSVRGPGRLRLLSASSLCLALFGLLNLGFMYSLATAAGHLASTISQSTQENFAYFSARPSTGHLLFDLVSLYGFWHSDFNSQDLHSVGWQSLFGLILWLSIMGMYQSVRVREQRTLHLVLLAFLIGCVLMGAGALFPLTMGLYSKVGSLPVFGIFRDSQKLMGFAVLAYAYYGAAGLSYLVSVVKSARWRLMMRYGHLVAIIPFAVTASYSYKVFPNVERDIFNGFYPAEYQEAEDIVGRRPFGESLLVLPWHGYMDLGWTGRNTANPVGQFFSGEVIYGDTVEIGTLYSTSNSAMSRYVESFLKPFLEGTERHIRAMMETLDASYAVILKSADYARYEDAMAGQLDMEKVSENARLSIYAFSPSPPPTRSDKTFPKPAKWRYAPWYGTSACVAIVVLCWVLIPAWRKRKLPNGDGRGIPLERPQDLSNAA